MIDDQQSDLKGTETADDRPRAKSAARPGKKAPAKKANKAGRKSKGVAKEIEQRIGYSFNDAKLLASALTHVSALKSPNDRAASYQRLEFLGDHVLGLAVSDMLFRIFPKGDEGELSKRLADLVRRETCADVARTLG